jgi:hypothetical protein
VLRAGTRISQEKRRSRRSRILTRAPVRLLAFQSEDGTLDLLRQLIAVAPRPARTVGQCFHARFLVAVKDFVAGFVGDPKPPAKLDHRLAGEPQAAAFRPSPNTPSKASLPPLGEEVSPMCAVQTVTHVSRISVAPGVLDVTFE